GTHLRPRHPRGPAVGTSRLRGPRRQHPTEDRPGGEARRGGGERRRPAVRRSEADLLPDPHRAIGARLPGCCSPPRRETQGSPPGGKASGGGPPPPPSPWGAPARPPPESPPPRA